MILTAHQPMYLPWLGLFHKIAVADKFVFLDTVQYPRGKTENYSNRNKIKTPNGPLWLTVPVRTAGKEGQLYTETEIDNSQPWKKKHWNSIRINYSKAPYFSRYSSWFETFYSHEWSLLSDANLKMLYFLLGELGIGTEVIVASSQLHLEGEKSDLVLDMCKKLGASTYIFGALGRDYADVVKFTENNVRAVFQEYAHPVYRQLYGRFEPYLSVIDLMFNEPDPLDVIMSCNITKEEV